MIKIRSGVPAAGKMSGYTNDYYTDHSEGDNAAFDGR